MKRIIILSLAAVLVLGTAACGKKSDDTSDGLVKGSHVGGNEYYDESSDETGDTQPNLSGNYRVLAVDEAEGKIRLEDLSTGLLRDYNYGLYTEVFDKNDVTTTDDSLLPGLVVSAEIEESSEDDSAKLQTVKISGDVWTLDDITDFKTEADAGAFYIDGEIYMLTADTKVFSDGAEVHINSLSENDNLTVIGNDKEIISIIVDTGHGTVHLVNAEDFIGGWITIGKRISSEITEDMMIEVPEGQYTLAVTNEAGYGDSEEIKVKKNEILDVDLNELKGEGPKYCELVFDIKTKGAKVYLNGEKQKTKDGKVNEVQYGVYDMTVKAKGYDDINVRLMVSSEEATIEVDMEKLKTMTAGLSDSGSSSSENSSSDGSSSSSENSGGNGKKASDTDDITTNIEAGSKAGSLAGSLAGSSHSTASSSTSSSSSSYEPLTSLAGSISALSGSSTSSVGSTLSTLSSLVDILGNKNNSNNNSSESD